MVDWVAHYDTIYAALGVPGTIEIAATNEVFDVTVMGNKLEGVQVSEEPTVASIKPVVPVRMYELAALGINRESLTGAIVTFSGASFQVTATIPRPGPTGEAGGELYLIVREFE
jgi:hypothetical protein